MIQSNALQIPLKDESVQCVVTSPAYWRLRDYGTATWEGGRNGCDHKPAVEPRKNRNRNGLTGGLEYMASQEPSYNETCGKCGAKRIDSQLGLEKTPDCGMRGFMRIKNNLTGDQKRRVAQWLSGEGNHDE